MGRVKYAESSELKECSAMKYGSMMTNNTPLHSLSLGHYAQTVVTFFTWKCQNAR
jgi:hypothetical protein